jgi:GIY-YIG catalytic domain
VSGSESRRTRRELIREYKETPRPMGVFRIRNTVNGRAFVGSSTDLPSILNRHRAQLRLGAHRNRDFQADWNSLGADAFEFEILDELERRDEPGYDPTDDLRALEALWIERLELPAGARY